MIAIIVIITQHVSDQRYYRTLLPSGAYDIVCLQTHLYSILPLICMLNTDKQGKYLRIKHFDYAILNKKKKKGIILVM